MAATGAGKYNTESLGEVQRKRASGEYSRAVSNAVHHSSSRDSSVSPMAATGAGKYNSETAEQIRQQESRERLSGQVQDLSKSRFITPEVVAATRQQRNNSSIQVDATPSAHRKARAAGIPITQKEDGTLEIQAETEAEYNKYSEQWATIHTEESEKQRKAWEESLSRTGPTWQELTRPVRNPDTGNTGKAPNIGNVYGRPTRPTQTPNHWLEDHTPQHLKPAGEAFVRWSKKEVDYAIDHPKQTAAEVGLMYVGGAAAGAVTKAGSVALRSGLSRYGAKKAAGQVDNALTVLFGAAVAGDLASSRSYEDFYGKSKNLLIGGAGFIKGAKLAGRLEPAPTRTTQEEITERRFRVLEGIEQTEITALEGPRTHTKIKTRQVTESELNPADVAAVDPFLSAPSRQFEVKYRRTVSRTDSNLNTQTRAAEGTGTLTLERSPTLKAEQRTLSGETLPQIDPGKWTAEFTGIPEGTGKSFKQDFEKQWGIEQYFGKETPDYNFATTVINTRARTTREITALPKKETALPEGAEQYFDVPHYRQADLFGFQEAETFPSVFHRSRNLLPGEKPGLFARDRIRTGKHSFKNTVRRLTEDEAGELAPIREPQVIGGKQKAKTDTWKRETILDELDPLIMTRTKTFTLPRASPSVLWGLGAGLIMTGSKAAARTMAAPTLQTMQAPRLTNSREVKPWEFVDDFTGIDTSTGTKSQITPANALNIQTPPITAPFPIQATRTPTPVPSQPLPTPAALDFPPVLPPVIPPALGGLPGTTLKGSLPQRSGWGDYDFKNPIKTPYEMLTGKTAPAKGKGKKGKKGRKGNKKKDGLVWLP